MFNFENTVNKDVLFLEHKIFISEDQIKILCENNKVVCNGIFHPVLCKFVSQEDIGLSKEIILEYHLSIGKDNLISSKDGSFSILLKNPKDLLSFKQGGNEWIWFSNLRESKKGFAIIEQVSISPEECLKASWIG